MSMTLGHVTDLQVMPGYGWVLTATLLDDDTDVHVSALMEGRELLFGGDTPQALHGYWLPVAVIPPLVRYERKATYNPRPSSTPRPDGWG